MCSSDLLLVQAVASSTGVSQVRILNASTSGLSTLVSPSSMANRLSTLGLASSVVTNLISTYSIVGVQQSILGNL